MQLGKYSFGIGDRFEHQGEAQLKAIIRAGEMGVEVTPVWNKSNREHTIVRSDPPGTRREADSAVKALDWTGPYFVDADHINLTNVEKFIPWADFFTLDVAAYINQPAAPESVMAFKKSCEPFGKEISVPGIDQPFMINELLLDSMAAKFLRAVQEAARIYRRIESAKGAGNFITEVSMDEVDAPQDPLELLFILKMMADLEIPAQTIAPKFTGRFNKGVDYSGDISSFSREFEQDILVIDYAVRNFGLPENLKLSVHSGSDKFSIYPVIARIITKYDKGIHIKTAGTTWLEEVIGLALSGEEALATVREIYRRALERREELCAPYADVIDIDFGKLPSAGEVEAWEGEKFAATLRHVPENPDYSPDVRQLMHVGYKIAAEMGSKYTSLLTANREIIAKCVETNIYDRHLGRLFGW
jgi:tagaturonate epimerase